jgi:hypothetical protein
MRFCFCAYGHKNIKALHKSTLEITKEDTLTPRGDCIIAVRSEHSCYDLPDSLKKLIRTNNIKIKIILEVADLRDIILGYGSKKLKLLSEKSIVIRKSNYIDGRTLMINANKAARDIDRRIINKLRDPNEKIKIIIEIEDN